MGNVDHVTGVDTGVGGERGDSVTPPCSLREKKIILQRISQS